MNPVPINRAKTRAMWLLTDQAAFALGNFAVNIACARWLTPVDYGTFALSFSGYILLTVLHWGAVVEPLLLIAPRVPRDSQRAYLMTALRWHVWESAGLAAIGATAFGAGLLGAGVAAWCVCASCLGAAAMLSLTSARRLCLAFLSPRASALAGLAYMAGTMAMALGLRLGGLVYWPAIWVAMGTCSLACTAVLWKIMLARGGAGKPFGMREFAAGHGAFARWGIPAAFAFWVRSDGAYLLLAHFAGLSAVAETRAMLTLCAPAVQVNSALNATWLVGFSQDADRGADVLRRAAAHLAAYAAAAAAVVAVAALAGGWAVAMIYHGRYGGTAWALPLFLLACALNGMETLLSSALKSAGRRRDGYLPVFAGAAATFVCALLAIPPLGVAGAVLAAVTGACAGLAAVIAAATMRARPDRGMAAEAAP